MLSDVVILAAGAGSSGRKVRVSASVAVVAESQLLVAEASMDCQAGERIAENRRLPHPQSVL